MTQIDRSHQVDPALPRLFSRPDRVQDPLYVLTVVYNSQRFRNRWKLYQDFAKMVAESGAILYTAEIAFGDRAFSVTEPDNPRHLQLRTKHEIWFKENALNLLVARLPLDWKYVAWVDADVMFVRDDWADETRHALQHCPLVQMWSNGVDLDSNHEIIQHHRSMAWCYISGDMAPEPDTSYPYAEGQVIYWHPGYAWACTRWAWNATGGLLDCAALGAADFHMGWGLIGRIEETIRPELSERYKTIIRLWANRADSAVKRNIGCVEGLVLHHWHGEKLNRGYKTRGQILIDTQYDPDRDLYRDWHGLWQLNPNSIELRDRIRTYFNARDEDALSQ